VHRKIEFKEVENSVSIPYYIHPQLHLIHRFYRNYKFREGTKYAMLFSPLQLSYGPGPFFFGRPRGAPVVVDFRFLPRTAGAVAEGPFSSSALVARDAACPKKSSPSSFQRSRTESGSLVSPAFFPLVFDASPAAESKEANCSSLRRSWTISLGFVTSVKFLFPTTMS